MTEQDFLVYIKQYGNHVTHVFGTDSIKKVWCYHVGHTVFEINGIESTAQECANLIKQYQRDQKIESILN